MDTGSGRSQSTGARLAALAGLAAVGIAVFAIVTGTLSGDEPGSSSANQAERERGGGQGQGNRVPARYEVRPGDSLTAISERFGVSIDEILSLNPDVDPQTIRPGIELKLRE